jgi:hypothetical protein
MPHGAHGPPPKNSSQVHQQSSARFTYCKLCSRFMQNPRTEKERIAAPITWLGTILQQVWRPRDEPKGIIVA